MKILFIGHTTGYGGAAISLTTNLKYLFENGMLDPNDCEIAVPYNERDLSTGAYHWFDGRVPFRFWYMPFSVAEKGGSKRLKSKLYSVFKETVSIFLYVGVYNHILKREKVTHLHLNSFVFWSLLPFLPKKIKKIIHMREMLSDDLSGKIAKRIINKYADTIIAISNQTANGLPRAIIVENPFDMYRARQFRNVRAELKSQFGLPSDSFVVSVFAPIGIQKGTDFLLEIVDKVPAHFLLVGDPYKGDNELFKKLLSYPNAHIFESGKDMDRYYAVTDVVLRCENYLPLGRTVFEGMYAGCISLLPISHQDSYSELIPYLDQMHTYRARDAESFYRAFMGIYRMYPNGVYNNRFASTSNVPTSAHDFMEALI